MTFAPKGGRARLEIRDPDSGAAWCFFPCQSGDPDDKNAGECSVPCRPLGTPRRGESPDWEYTGPPDAPTLTPSINCKQDTCWHGYITNGEIKP